MADDFRVKVKADLDTSEAEQKLNNLTKGNKTVKLNVDSAGAAKSVKDTDSAIKTVTKSTQTFGSTLKSALNVGLAYGVMSKGFQLVGDTARKATDAVKDFDGAIMDLRMATGGSYNDVSKLVSGYNKMGQQLGAVTTEVTAGADAWLRQGHSISDTNTLIKDSMQLAKIASIDTADATTYLTSAMKGYKVEVDEVSKIVDKLTSVDLVSATDAGGLAEAMSRTAVSANEAGVSMDRLIGYLASVGEVTQEGMSVIGNSFKTFFARYSDIKTDKLELIDEDGTTETLNDVEQSLKNVGIDMRSTITEFDNFGDVLDNLAKKWDTLNGTQKDAIAKAFGGVRQKNRFLVLMENYQNAAKYMDVAMDSEGSAANKFNAYLDTLEAKTKTLQATFEALAVDTISSELVGDIISATTAVVGFLDKTNLLKGSLAGIATAGAIKGFTLMATGISKAAQTLNSFNAALQLVKAGNLGETEIQKLSVMTANLSKSQLKAVLSSEALSVSQRKAILMAHGMEEAEAEAALSTMGLATSEGAATGATFTLSGALKGLWATLKANPLILVIAAVTAIVSAYQSYKDKVEEARQAALDAGSAAKEEAANLRSLYAAYAQANDAYKKNAGSKEDLEGATESLLKALGVEQSEIDKLTEKYGSLDKAINQATIDALKDDYSDLLGGYNPAKKNVEDKGKTDLKGNTYDALSYYGDSSNKATQQARKFLADKGFIKDMYGSAGGTSYIQGIEGEIDSFERISEAYQKYIDMRKALEDNISDSTYSSEELSNSKLYQAINDRINLIKEEIETADGYVDDINQTAAQIQIMEAFNSEGIPESQADVDKFTQSMIEAADSNDRFVGTSEQVRDSIINVLSSMSELKGFSIKGSSVDDLMSKISKNLKLDKNANLKSWVEGLNENELKIVADVSANTDTADWTIDQWKERLQTELQANAVLNIDISKESTKLGNFNAAISESLGAKGLGDESIKNITAMYKNIEGFNADKLFDKTANGIKLNSDELAKLESKYENLNKVAIEDKLEGLKDKYKALTKDMEKCGDKQSVQYEKLVNERNAVVDDINSVSDLAAQYAGLTSAYQKWIDAQSNGEDGDMYDAIREGLSKAQDLYKQGLVGTDEFKSYVDLLSGKDLSAASANEVVEAYRALGKEIGNTGYKATDFLEEGNTGVKNFLNAINKLNSDWASINSEGNWDIKFDNQEVADALGVDVEFVESMLQKLKDYGFEIDVDSSIATENLTQLQSVAEKANEELIKAGKTKIDFDFETTNLKKVNGEIEDATKLLDSLKDKDGKLNLDSKDVKNAQFILASLLRQKQELSKPEIMKVDVSNAESDVEKAVGKLQELQSALNQLEIDKQVGVDTTDSEKKVQELVGEINSLPDDVKTNLNLNTDEAKTALANIEKADINVNAHLNDGDTAAITTTLSSISPEMIVKAGVDESKVVNYKPGDKDAKVVYYVDGTKITGWEPPTKYAKVVYTATGVHELNGTAHLHGTAKAVGDWGAKHSETALMGEIEPEIWVHAKTGTWELVTNPQFRKVQKGDVIFSGQQTKSLLQNGKVNSFGHSFLDGTAYGTGTGAFVNDTSSTSTTSTTSTTSKTYKPPKSEKTKDKGESALEKFRDWFSKLFDWIEIKLERQTDKISRYIQKADAATSRGDYTYANKQYKNAISETETQISNERQAQKKYNKTANSVLNRAIKKGLLGKDKKKAKKKAEKIKAAVKNGSIDISKYGEKTREVIESYREWYEKSREAQQAIYDLQEDMQEYSRKMIENIQQSYEEKDAKTNNQISLLELKSKNAKSVKNKNKNLTKIAQKYDKIVENDTKEINKYNDIVKSKKNYIGKKNKDLRGKNYSKLSKKNKKKVDKVIDEAQKYAKAGKAIPSKTLDKIANYYAKGYIKAGFYDACIQYNDALDAKKEAEAQKAIDVETAKAEKAALGAEMIENIEQYYKNKDDEIQRQTTQYETAQALKKARRQDLTAADYNNLINQSKLKQANLNNEANAIQKQIDDNIVKGLWTTSSQEYKDAVQKVADYRNEVQQCIIEQEELKVALRDDVYWRTYERAHNAAKRLSEVLSGINDLIDENMLFNSNNELTKYGIAQLSLLTKEYESARKEVENYSNDIDNLNNLYAQGEYTQEEYREKLGELESGVLSSASTMKNSMNEILKIYQDIEKNELDSLFKVIDARKKALDSKKAYYDYDKTLKTKNKDIQLLQAQLDALQGVDGLEARAKRAKLQAELAEKQEELNDTIQEHQLSLSQEALDGLKDSMQEAFENKWKDIYSDLHAIKELMTGAKNLTNASTQDIAQTLAELFGFYGVSASSQTAINGTIANKGYASGTKSVPSNMLAWTQEHGDEFIIRKSDGAILTPLQRGDSVLSNRLTENLYKWGGINPDVIKGSIFGSELAKAYYKAPEFNISQPININGNLLNVEGNVDSTVVTDLEKFAKKFYKGAYEYTTREIVRDARKMGIK